MFHCIHDYCRRLDNLRRIAGPTMNFVRRVWEEGLNHGLAQMIGRDGLQEEFYGEVRNPCHLSIRSSFSDCISSLEVVSSSLVDCSFSLVDFSSSCEVCISSRVAFKASRNDCASGSGRTLAALPATAPARHIGHR